MTSQTDRPQTLSGHPLSRLDIWIVKIGNIIGWLYFAAVVISVYEVIMRYGFNQPTTWVHETTMMLVGIGMLWGGTYCMAEDRHIRVTVVRDALNKKVRRIIDMVVAVLNLLFCVGLVYAGYIMARKAFFDPTGAFRLQRSGSAYNSPSPAIVKIVLFFVVMLMTLQAIQQLYARYKALQQPLSEESTGN